MKKVVCWFSAGVTSAVATKKAIELYGQENCRVIMIDTFNEDEDSYRFTYDCERWFGIPIEHISHKKYKRIQDVWIDNESLNVATGAICSTVLKRQVREAWESVNTWEHQVFGFDIREGKRAENMALNYPKCKPIFPLLFYGLNKKRCIQILEDAGIEIPRAYKLGFHNNNCLQTGCVQGGIGYWQKMQRDFPDKFAKMAKMEHDLTNLKGEPVTMLKDQGKNKKGKGLVFLLPHPDYPDVKDISMMTGREPKPLTECNGFCGINDGKKNPTELEINYA